ncbi:ATP synthase F1 subunit delta [Oscillochloris sp. ZM17-4]|uniref:ATP synthase F1 subunit delta n=1 Tax=Oscillochloris sp. ZM17-4 TaxID=2866714 RepID=UPI001C730C1B|nr:ATP synthase F1 subunit delta [Oscillochloris sp. ZM17-4]MBX0327945.1 ATP synthase F1 subunit delta [Oscillochloris sp. ZM17-4]
MATKVDPKAIAGTLYDALMGSAMEQLQTAASKLAGVGGDDLSQRVSAALPADAMPQVRNFLLGLAKEGLLDQVGDVAEAFGRLTTSASAQSLDSVVTSAVTLSADQQAAIVADLRQRYGADLSATFDVDASLIGGLLIRVGDRVLDNSLRTRLSAVQRNMLTS